MTISNRGLFGLPALPFVDAKAYAGGDVFVDLLFLDHTNTPNIPSAFTYQLDDITNVLSMIPATVVNTGITGSTYTLQLPAASMQMSNTFQSSQYCQLSGTATLSDGSTVPFVAIIELCAIQTPS